MWVVQEAVARDSRRATAFPTSDIRPMLPGAALAHLIERARIRAAFPVLHGPFGEDGTVQGMLELHGIACVGSGCAASAVAMDKIRTRECLLARGIPMAAAYLPETPIARADPDREAERIAASVGFPCFLKVDSSGSSIGVVRAGNAADVRAFLADRTTTGAPCRRFLAERPVQGEEISVPVLGNSGADPIALPPIGIYPRRQAADSFFDYRAKYDAGATDEVVPPRGLDAAAIAEVQALALRCHEALVCDGLSRTDMIVAADGPRVLEVNTLPGFTPASLYPKAAAAHGIPYSELLGRLVDLALARPQRVALPLPEDLPK
jgi:D-alanine-D-alanine ligase